MAEVIKIVGTEEIPSVTLDAENGIFEITGRSFPENVERLFLPIMEWLKEYITEPNENTAFKFQLEYFNSSSARKIIELLFILEKLADTGKGVKIIWQYTKDDEMIRTKGVELMNLVKIPFEFEAVD